MSESKENRRWATGNAGSRAGPGSHEQDLMSRCRPRGWAPAPMPPPQNCQSKPESDGPAQCRCPALGRGREGAWVSSATKTAGNEEFPKGRQGAGTKQWWERLHFKNDCSYVTELEAVIKDSELESYSLEAIFSYILDDKNTLQLLTKIMASVRSYSWLLNAQSKNLIKIDSILLETYSFSS